MPYYCSNCQKRFEYPIANRTTKGRIFGVAFYDEATVEELLCPYCKSEEIEKEEEKDE